MKNKLTRSTRAAATLFLLFIIFPVQAEIYKWVDANGKTHFSDKPLGEKVEEIKIKLSPAIERSPEEAGARKERADNFLRAREEERAIKKKAIAEKKKDKKERKRKCLAAQKEFGRLSRARVIYYDGKDGKRDFIGDDERTRVLAAAKAEIKKWCKK
jgi:hypothetical protein